MAPNGQRVIALLVLLVVGLLALPATAFFVDGEGSENAILPVFFLVVAVVGALVGRALPGLAGESPGAGRSMLVGAVAGVVMGILGVLVFFALLSGFDGA